MYCINCGIEITDDNMVDLELEVCDECIALDETIFDDNVGYFYKRQSDKEFINDFINNHCDIEENY